MTLLTFSNKYVVSSTTAVSTTSGSLVDDTQATVTFSLDSSKVVLVIYQANNIVASFVMSYYGMQNAISIDGTDVAISHDSPNATDGCTRNCVFWVGTLGAGSHTVKGRFASNVGGQTATVHNRVLVVVIFNGDEFYYVDNATSASTSSTSLVDDPYAQVTFTPSAACKALIMYNVSNSYGSTESYYGKKVAVNIGGVDYGQAEKSARSDTYSDSVFTVHALTLSASSTTVKGRFAANTSATVTVSRRQLAVLLFADSTLLDIVTSTTRVSTSSSSLVDDTQAIINRTTTDTRELLVIAMGTKREGTSSSSYGECYGINIDGTDVANSRGSPQGSSRANSAATAYAQQLTAGAHTVKGRFSNNYSGTAVISARQVAALWFSIAAAYTVNLTESIGLKEMRAASPTHNLIEQLGLAEQLSRQLSIHKIFIETLGLADKMLRTISVTFKEHISLADVLSAFKVKVLELFEHIGLAESKTDSVTHVLSEKLGLSDLMSRTILYCKVLVERIGLADYYVKHVTRTLIERIGLADALTGKRIKLLMLLEHIGLSDKTRLLRLKVPTRLKPPVRVLPAEREEEAKA